MANEGCRNTIRPISMYLYTFNDTLRSQRKRVAIRRALLPFTRSGEPHQFMVFSKYYEEIIEIGQSLGMFNIRNQWLFFVMEEKSQNFDPMLVTQFLQEGANIAFALNETQLDCVVSFITLEYIFAL